MQITAPCVVSLTWLLKDTLGDLINELAEPTEFFFGGDDLLGPVEEALTGQEAGFTASLHIEPHQAFGDYDAELVFFEDRGLFPELLEPGMQFDGIPEGAKTEGLSPDAIYTVTEVYPTHVVLDGNHPLAGIALRIDLKVVGVREATADEIENKSAAEPALSIAPTTPGNATRH